MITSHTTVHEFDLDDLHFTSNVEYDLDYSTEPAEPYSWGGSRGVEAIAGVTIQTATIGNKVASRDELIEIVGLITVEEVETYLLGKAVQEMGYAL